MNLNLTIDPARMDEFETGIDVRALGPDNKWQSTDISRLTKESLFLWLRSRGGNNLWAENTVAALLGHQGLEEGDDKACKIDTWLIWSREHGAWWMPDSSGYTRDLDHAGHYSLEQATAICEHANRYSEQVQETMFPAPE